MLTKRDRIVWVVLAGALSCAVIGASTSWAAEPTTIELSAADTGRTFEGIGGVSAGASTRLLYDYPEPYRSDILYFLFSPHFGAALQHLNVEIGSGENSTSGSEPSHVITREELAQPKARGYEFWLMKEARNRNPAVILDCLPWAYPGWIKNRFSQEATDWIRGLACRLGRGPHHAVRSARLAISRRGLRPIRDQNLERLVRHAERSQERPLEHDRLQ
jgi:O-glycosyl hydrolase